MLSLTMPTSDRWQSNRQRLAVEQISKETEVSFWQNTRSNEQAAFDRLGQYYVEFFPKPDTQTACNSLNAPMLNYHGRIGLQYNPITIAQWGLTNHDSFKRANNPQNRQRFIAASDWFCDHLQQTAVGDCVWSPGFSREYKPLLDVNSKLARGMGISLLVRAHAQTGEQRYRETADRVFGSLAGSFDCSKRTTTLGAECGRSTKTVASACEGILSGHIWSAWGIYDYFLANRDRFARDIFAAEVSALVSILDEYDVGFWSLYERSDNVVPKVASFFFHELHIVQLRVMYFMTGESIFADMADRWQRYTTKFYKRVVALIYRSASAIYYSPNRWLFWS